MDKTGLDRRSTAKSSLRLTMRSAVGGAMCAIGLVAASCQGDNCATAPTNTGVDTGLSSELASGYFLTSIANGGLPATYKDSATYHLRVWSDTLFIKVSDSTYTEGGRIGRQDIASGDELLTSYKLTPAQKYTQLASKQISIPQFLGGAGTAIPQPNYGRAALEVTAGGKKWFFYPKYPY